MRLQMSRKFWGRFPMLEKSGIAISFPFPIGGGWKSHMWNQQMNRRTIPLIRRLAGRRLKKTALHCMVEFYPDQKKSAVKS
ncbi:hypothetical protein CT154_06025 [Komagataeibacter xylinus]|nr:hypothetical protein CT154_06025 [Komagataeibacter xylinus]KDU94327.1 hypothetical protein GLUCORHAEAF1_14535 [Komagataeibacter rhaeticus AF1]